MAQSPQSPRSQFPRPGISSDPLPESLLSGVMAQEPPLQIDHLQNPPGEGHCHIKDKHTVFINFTSRPLAYVQTQDGKTHSGLYQRGDFTVTPADVAFYARWEGEENCLQIQMNDSLLRSVTQEIWGDKGDRLQLVPQFQAHDPQLEAIAQLLLAEHQQQYANGYIYLESLAHVLAVNLLRHHGTTRPVIPTYGGGLPPHHLSRVLDYIDAYLDQDIKLADLARSLNMSQFHFSRMFKQSLGLSPHQYLIQQRVERAKRLLQTTDHPIANVALDCGFNSHSHLSQKFRQLTGVTPTAYRNQIAK